MRNFIIFTLHQMKWWSDQRRWDGWDMWKAWWRSEMQTKFEVRKLENLWGIGVENCGIFKSISKKQAVNCISLFQGMDQWRTLVSTEINLLVPYKAWNFLTMWATIITVTLVAITWPPRNVITVKSRRKGWSGHVARVGCKYQNIAYIATTFATILNTLCIMVSSYHTHPNFQDGESPLVVRTRLLIQYFRNYPRREAVQTPPSSADFKNAWSYSSIS
jgi:hypothetical protein